MELVADASAFIAVALNEEEREQIVAVTTGFSLVSPEILPYELGNAFVAMTKKRRLTDREAIQALLVARNISVRLIAVNVSDSVKLAFKVGSYAYDAYYLQCCLELSLPLLTLDIPMRRAARTLGIQLVE